MSTQRAMTTREWLMLFGLAGLWSTSFFFLKVLSEHLPILTIVFARVSLAAVALWIIVYASGSRMPTDLKAYITFAKIGMLTNVIPFSLITFGELTVSSGMAAILNATTPLFAVVLMHYASRDERFSAAKAGGVVLGFAGVLILVWPSSLQGFSIGSLACVLASAIYAVAGLYAKRASKNPPLVTSAGMLTGSALILAPFVLFIDKPWLATGITFMNTWLELGILALFCTALAYILYFRILTAAGVTNLTLVTFIVPIGAVTVGAVMLREVISMRTVAGALTIFLGLAAIDGRVLRMFRRDAEVRETKARAA